MQSWSKDWGTLRDVGPSEQKGCGSLLSWTEHALAPFGQTPAAHHRALIAALDDVAASKTVRLMVLMPPGSAKSTYASVLFPAWWFTQHPASSVIAASHTAELACHFGRRARDLAIEQAARLGYRLRPDCRAVANWRTESGGEYFAAGVRGPVIGRRADLILIDDPVKSLAEADSPLHRERVWSWYCSDLLTRLKPGGRVVLVMTRWHRDDLGGRLLAHAPEQWRVLRLPALAEEDDPLGREPGAPLWPAWEDEEALARRRTELGERAWAAMYQQSPRLSESNFFDTARIPILEAAPSATRVVRAWDLAATEASSGTDPDWTVGLKLQRNEFGCFAVLDVVRFRGTPLAVERAIVNTATQDGRGVTVCIPCDPGQAGKVQTALLATRLAGYPLSISPEAGAKQSRAMPVSAQIEAGNFSLVAARWNRVFLDELRDFPNGSKDDQVDALSRAFAEIVGSAKPSRRLAVPLMVR